MDKPLISPDELIRQKVAPPPFSFDSLESFSRTPEGPVVFPPILTGEIPDDAPLAERLAISPSSCSGKKRSPRTLFGFRLPSAWRDKSLPAILLALGTTRRGLGYTVSIILHLFIFILLAVIAIRVRSQRVGGEPLSASFSGVDEITLNDSFEGDSNATDSLTTLAFDAVTPEIFLPVDTVLSPSAVSDLVQNILPADRPIGDLPSDREDAGALSAPLIRRGATSGRNAQTRRRGLPGREQDTTEASELAVEAGLAWLARHQFPDGGWSFDLDILDENEREGECRGQCSNSTATAGGELYRKSLHPSRMAATGMALLPFLGAGYTHMSDNPYRETIRSGLNYLIYRARIVNAGVDFRAGVLSQGMYTQAIVALTLCEAFEMTGDAELKPLADGAARFIAASQRTDGGWRYEAIGDAQFFPDIPGDTSVAGWQMLALKSAASAGLDLPAAVFYKVGAFLDSVGIENESKYRYQSRTNESDDELRGTTAVGLLMREYLGWGPEKRAIKRGLGHLDDWFDEMNDDWSALKKGKTERMDRRLTANDGRIRFNLYYAYYAALAMHHVGGKNWHKTFAHTRDFLIQTQSNGDKSPHETGSWLFYDRYMNDGGRLLNTALSVLILETPYRYLPMYQK